VDNALKYSGSVPTVVFTNSQVIVQDFGPGFSDTEINTLGKGIVKSRKGSGLGLYFTNSLLATINWKMKIENNSKGGCLVASKLLATAN
jgi:signal transduction histidine kinase